MRALLVLAAILALLPAAPVAAGTLEATGPWHLDYEATQCVASRNYGSDASPVMLTLIPSVTGEGMRILVVRNGRTEQRQEPAKLTLGNDKRIDTYSFIYEVPEKNHRVIFLSVPMARLRTAATSGMIGIESDAWTGKFAANLLPDVLTALDTCLADLHKAWNVTIPLPKATAGFGTRPIFTAADYPLAAAYRGLSGAVGVSILIDETGKVADCSVDQPSGVAILDAASCYVIQNRAKFVPATDAGGKPIRSAVAQKIEWRINH